MAYSAITAGEVDADSPLDTALMGKVKDNFIDHETRIATGEAGGFPLADGTVSSAKLAAPAVGDYIIFNNLDERTTGSTTYNKLKEVKIGTAGTYRIKFSLHSDGVNTIYGRIYKNGSAFGTERNTSSATYVEYSEDLTFAAGDLIQVYCKVASSGTAYIKELKICVVTPLIAGALNGY